MLKIYPAAPFGRAEFVWTIVRPFFEGAGFALVGKWFHPPHVAENLKELYCEEKREYLEANAQAIRDCDVLLGIVWRREGTQMFREAQMARALGKPVVWIVNEGNEHLGMYGEDERIARLPSEALTLLGRRRMHDRLHAEALADAAFLEATRDA